MLIINVVKYVNYYHGKMTLICHLLCSYGIFMPVKIYSQSRPISAL